jgi:hypothetical protein
MAKLTIAQLQAQLAERDQTIRDQETRIAELQRLIETLETKTRRPASREQPDTIKALPDLRLEQPGGRIACPLNAEHGEITPNIHHKCPKCYTYCIWANSAAGKKVLAKAQPSATN